MEGREQRYHRYGEEETECRVSWRGVLRTTGGKYISMLKVKS
jgi:hypothetical protein